MRSPQSPHTGTAAHGTTRFARRLLVIGVAILAGMLFAPAVVFGHAELGTVTPADKSTVGGPLAEIVMTFTEPVKPANSSIKLVDSGGKVVVEGSTVDAGDAKTMRLALPATLAPGSYTVRWTTASALDGDIAHGTTTFTLNAAPSVAPSTPPSSAPSGSPSASPATPPSIAPSPSPSSPPATPAASTGDAVIPVVVALIVLAALGLWLLRGRLRGAR